MPTEEESPSYSASTSLLRRVKLSDNDAWRRLVRIYGPLVYRWSRNANLQPVDSEEIVSVVFSDVLYGIERFERDGKEHSFRRWLSTICYHRILKHRKKLARQPMAHGGSTANLRFSEMTSELVVDDPIAERDEVRWLRQRIMEVVKEEYTETQWEIFRRTVLDQESPASVAESLSVGIWMVYKTRSRILLRLKRETLGPENGQ